MMPTRNKTLVVQTTLPPDLDQKRSNCLHTLRWFDKEFIWSLSLVPGKNTLNPCNFLSDKSFLKIYNRP